MHEEYIKPYFKFECAPIANPEAIVKGEKYRFTILTSKMIRLEWADNGKFEDRPTQSVWFRKLAPVKFETRNKGPILEIETEELLLSYNTLKKFSRSSLIITLKQEKKKWRFGQKDRGNLKGTYRTLDGRNGSAPIKDGLMSKNGFTVYDDSDALVFDENYWLTTRQSEEESKTNLIIDQYFFGYGRDYLSILKDFYQIAGKTPLIPRYVLGNWWSRYWEYTEDELKKLISDFDKYQIPMSVCIIDMDWHFVKLDPMYGNGWTGYTWNPELFPDPPGLLKWLHERNLKVSMNLHPADGIKGHERCYKDFADFMGVDKVNEERIKFDISDPKFVSGYFDFAHHPHEDDGVDFWWIDWQQGFRTKVKGLDPLWMLNHLHFFDQGRPRPVSKSPTEKNFKTSRSFIFSRWGGKGNHRYPIGFSGDTFISWRSLAFQPYFTTTASNVGYGWWSHDIGGHMGGMENAELYTRWVQFGVFSPIMRLHSTKRPFHKREPWRYDLNTLTMVGDVMRLRHQLIPYIYSMAYQNYANDIPLMRPLYYYFPDDDQSYNFKNQYYFGSELIAAPITEPIHKSLQRVYHTFYLPEGEYFNYFTDEYYPGFKIYKRLYRVSDIPVFAKAGAIIPLGDDHTVDGKIPNGTANPKIIRVDIFPGESNKFELYEDDGESEAYRKGEHYITTFTWNWENTTNGIHSPIFSVEKPATIPAYIPKERTYVLRFHCLHLNESPKVTIIGTAKGNTSISQDRALIEITLNSNTFTKAEVVFTTPEIFKHEKIRENAYSMLEDAPLSTMTKMLINNAYFKKDTFNEADMDRLVKRIKRQPRYLLPGFF
jgi:alpha-glucosidase (family GH31 glycosyl hydrolase)